jgi:hypothetical protein
MPMRRRLSSSLAAGLLVAACGSSGPTTAPATTGPVAPPTVAVTAAPPAATPASTGVFDGLDYSLDLPAGWTSFDLSDPAGQAALDAFVKSNPDFAGAIAAFKALPNVTMAVNPLVGNVMISLSLPTGGLPLDTIATTFTSQFAAVPGIKEPPVAEDVTLPAGQAVHWHITLEGNAPTGGTFEVGESIYLVANATTAVLVEFVETGPAGVPQEQQIIQSLKFAP